MKMILLLAAVILLSGACCGRSGEERLNLKVLFVGDDPKREYPPQNFMNGAGIAESRYAADMETRMPAFMKLLRENFTEVKGIDARDYTEKMTEEFDVVIFDAVPRPVVPGIKDVNRKQPDTSLIPESRRRALRNVVDTKEVMSARYFSEGYDKPTLFVGDKAGIMGAALGLKLNWFCRCLDAHAYDVEDKHPVFHQPFAINLSCEERIAPSSACSGVEGVWTPGVMKMWRVQTEGYREGESGRYRQGLVAFGDGFEDSPDAEKIAGGVSDKGREAVAIGRHGNFLMWGFAASPDYMTPEARKVFVNAVCYINRFKGQQPVARKYVNGWVTREKMRSRLRLFDEESYKSYVKNTKAYNGKLSALKQDVESLRAAMKSVSGDLIGQAWPSLRPVLERTAFLEFYLKRDMVQAGCKSVDEYQRYLKENMDYFYGGKGDFSFSVDEDLKHLGVPVGKKEMLDRAIKLLKGSKAEQEAGRRLLHRYTLENFVSAADWEQWFEREREHLFFSESCGYKFLGNKEVRYTRPIVDEGGVLQDNPVRVAGCREGNEVVIRMMIKPGFHIYADSGEEGAYVLTKLAFAYTEGIHPSGNLVVPKARIYDADPKVRIYNGDIEFRQPLVVTEQNKEKKTVCTVTYQACNATICLPPVTEDIEIIFHP